MKNILIAGGTGFIGMKLYRMFEKSGYQVSLLSRSHNKSSGVRIFNWNPDRSYLPFEAIQNQDVIINLSGVGIADKIWTKKRKNQILHSRTASTRILVQSILEQQVQPLLFINASAIGYYGHRPNEVLSECSTAGTGFLSEVCQRWEKEVEPLQGRVNSAILRLGIVLSSEGGSFPKLSAPHRFGLNNIFGKGKQQISWIHITDLLSIFSELIEGKLVPDIYNATSENSVNQLQFNQLILKCLNKRSFKLHVPEKILSVLIGDFSSLFLDSQDVVPKKLKSQRFTFTYPFLEDALKELL